MRRVDRRTFLKTAGVALAGRPAATDGTARRLEPTAGHWKKAFMLGGLTKGPVLPAFQLLKEAGFEGVELISPNQLDPAEVLAAATRPGS